VMPDDPAVVRIERKRRVVIEVLLVDAAQDELRRRARDRGADEDPPKRRIVARHHPRPDVPTLLERDVTPRLVARLAGAWDRPRAPQLPPRLRVVRGDDTALVSRVRLALPPGDHLAVG